MKRVIYTTLFFVFALANSAEVVAQKKKDKDKGKDFPADSIQLMRKFISLCNDYKRQPMHLSLDYISTTNSLIKNDEPGNMHAEFYSLPRSGYLRFGEMEEIISDSMALLIGNDMKKMIIYRNSKQLLDKMNQMIGVPVPDSSLKHMLGFFEISETAGAGNENQIHLISRKKLKNTEIPLEELSLKYNSKTNEPVEVTNLKRQPEPISKEQFNELNSKETYAGKLIKIEENYFLASEQKTLYQYKLIDHNPSMTIPVKISDRIMKTADGKYMPVQGYENYKISVQR